MKDFWCNIVHGLYDHHFVVEERVLVCLKCKRILRDFGQEEEKQKGQIQELIKSYRSEA